MSEVSGSLSPQERLQADKWDYLEQQRDYWMEQLEIAERSAEYARRMLGLLAVEGIDR